MEELGNGIVKVEGGYRLADGRTVPRAQLIRELFNQDWKRADIAKLLDIPYNIVFQATANLANAHHSPGNNAQRGPKMVTLPTGEEIPRSEYIKQQVALGRSRAEIAKELGISTSAVWNVTKGTTDGRRVERHYVKLENGEEIPRNEYIRRRYLEGATRREIANELGCDYTIVWQAISKLNAASADNTDNVASADNTTTSNVNTNSTSEDEEVNFPE